jgi:hypothetical protein
MLPLLPSHALHQNDIPSVIAKNLDKSTDVLSFRLTASQLSRNEGLKAYESELMAIETAELPQRQLSALRGLGLKANDANRAELQQFGHSCTARFNGKSQDHIMYLANHIRENETNAPIKNHSTDYSWTDLDETTSKTIMDEIINQQALIAGCPDACRPTLESSRRWFEQEASSKHTTVQQLKNMEIEAENEKEFSSRIALFTTKPEMMENLANRIYNEKIAFLNEIAKSKPPVLPKPSDDGACTIL